MSDFGALNWSIVAAYLLAILALGALLSKRVKGSPAKTL